MASEASSRMHFHWGLPSATVPGVPFHPPTAQGDEFARAGPHGERLSARAINFPTGCCVATSAISRTSADALAKVLGALMS